MRSSNTKLTPLKRLESSFAADLAHVLYDSTFELVDVWKPFVLQVSTRFFAPDSASAIQHNVLVFLIGQQVFSTSSDFVSKGLCVRAGWLL